MAHFHQTISLGLVRKYKINKNILIPPKIKWEEAILYKMKNWQQQQKISFNLIKNLCQQIGEGTTNKIGHSFLRPLEARTPEN